MENEQHIQMNQLSPEGDKTKLYPENTAWDVKVTPTNNIPATAENMNDVVESLGSLAFKDSITIPPASTDSYGVVKLSDDTTDITATETAATTKAVSEVAASAVKTTGNETVSGVKTFSDGLQIGDVKFSYTVEEDGSKIITVGLAE